MVPPAMMTALHSFSTWAKWTAGFNSRNLTLLSDRVPGRKKIWGYFTLWHFDFITVLYLVLCFQKWYLVCVPPLCRLCCCWWEPWRNPPPASWETQTALSLPLWTPAGLLKMLQTWAHRTEIFMVVVQLWVLSAKVQSVESWGKNRVSWQTNRFFLKWSILSFSHYWIGCHFFQ